MFSMAKDSSKTCFFFNWYCFQFPPLLTISAHDQSLKGNRLWIKQDKRRKQNLLFGFLVHKVIMRMCKIGFYIFVSEKLCVYTRKVFRSLLFRKVLKENVNVSHQKSLNVYGYRRHNKSSGYPFKIYLYIQSNVTIMWVLELGWRTRSTKRTPSHANPTQKGWNKLINKAHLRQRTLDQSDVQ